MKPLLAVAVLAANLALAETPVPAGARLEEAKTAAADTGRTIFLIFGASWCGWCHKLDGFLESARVSPIIQKYFVLTHVTVQENGAKKELNTPGGDALMKRVGGPAGLPFFAFLDKDGEMIVNSMEPGKNGKGGGNIGHPSAPHEVDWFLAMVRKGAPRITPDEVAVLEGYLRAQGK